MEDFLYNSTSSLCYCKQGYRQQGLTCQEICGDGIVIAAECDDGNTEDGDGCSSKCEIEPLYRCSTSNSLPASACQFVFSDIQVTLIKMERVDR
jgi:cysteine-rich repeat protein